MTAKIKIYEKGKNKKYFWMNVWNGQNHGKMMDVNITFTPEDLDDLEQQIKNVKKINRRDYFKEFFLQRRYLGTDFGDYFRITDLGKRFIIKYDEHDFKKLKLNARIKIKHEFNIMMDALNKIDKILIKNLQGKKDLETDDSRKNEVKIK